MEENEKCYTNACYVYGIGMLGRNVNKMNLVETRIWKRDLLAYYRLNSQHIGLTLIEDKWKEGQLRWLGHVLCRSKEAEFSWLWEHSKNSLKEGGLDQN